MDGSIAANALFLSTTVAVLALGYRAGRTDAAWGQELGIGFVAILPPLLYVVDAYVVDGVLMTMAALRVAVLGIVLANAYYAGRIRRPGIAAVGIVPVVGVVFLLLMLCGYGKRWGYRVSASMAETAEPPERPRAPGADRDGRCGALLLRYGP